LIEDATLNFGSLGSGCSDFLSFDFDTFILFICKHNLSHNYCDIVGFSAWVVQKVGTSALAEWRQVVMAVRVAFRFFCNHIGHELRVENIVAVSHERTHHIDNLQ